MKLDTKAFALTCGILWSLTIFVLTWWIIAFEGASGHATVLGMIYRGYSVSPVGSIIGAVWGFFDGAIGGAIFAWLYNRLSGGA